MITKEMADREIITGLSAICAWCEHWHNAKMRSGNIKSCGVIGCGGIASGRVFPEYRGPLENSLTSICFICGDTADAAIEINGRMIGVCNQEVRKNKPKKCIDLVRDILSKQGVVARERVVAVVNNG